MKHIVAGIVAHVDAGKTTLSEAMLYLGGGVRRLGRVDHGDAFLDTESLEKQRGITIHAHQARVVIGQGEDGGATELTLLDTPGHVDFAAETERVLRVLDYAILVVSGTDGVQGHTETLWRLLARYQVPVFVFVNKCDAAGFDRQAVMAQLRRRLSDAAMDFTAMPGVADGCGDAMLEDLATLDESAMEDYLRTGTLDADRVRAMVAGRRVFPVFFGSALRLDGVDGLMAGLAAYTRERTWPAEFGARVYKVSHDAQHNRLTWLRVTGGTLNAKAVLTASTAPADGQAAPEPAWREKSDQVRVYNGAKHDIVQTVPAGGVCAVTGLTHTYPGEGLGAEADAEAPSLQPVLTYTVLPPDAADAASAASEADAGDTEDGEGAAAAPRPAFDDLTRHQVLAALRELEDEEPLLHVAWIERLQEIHVQPMGAVQLEVIQQTLRERFGLDVGFGPGGILYRETVTAPIEGVGHFEPLRHYAEAHILIEPGEPGSGVTVASAVSGDDLVRNWQRLILTHLSEKEHLGTLIGAPITDVRLTLVAGRAHDKHTEGGDFRQATYRAVRQGLMELRAGVSGHPTADQTAAGRPGAGDGAEAEADDGRDAGVGAFGPCRCRVLEPWYAFRLEVPQDMLGRAISDVQRMSGSFAPPAMDGDYATVEGECPVSEMRDYATDVNVYTRGRGRLACTFAGYRPCHDENRVVAAARYDPAADVENTPDSVFCAHGAGYPVKWYRVPDFMHLPWAVG
ncbi:TetM/TetW/TetO/TetS family tetracycline resistance ribosomal protection protein [Bifidobacterium pullorum subsp. saeculare]|uniref:TetM/TetW/TetO/TetS family tetracycline resistance ribosomal protection protein n=1 Tax=Bifidobacterium pullorum subsp. saeculare TaxID=78257 RepID=A0A938WWI7_9BIFI|nr:TetM/TetW/TetO/TetS family tetracycline resistance ribosomal protection protein [Bifidobacterium pullorum]MBM6698895.1 TetM/TetW/TetO/TetS family tetracycline resistance ribosomal protection protein [Bifidobacterium pullorum subsp. saeculare]